MFVGINIALVGLKIGQNEVTKNNVKSKMSNVSRHTKRLFRVFVCC